MTIASQGEYERPETDEVGMKFARRILQKTKAGAARVSLTGRRLASKLIRSIKPTAQKVGASSASAVQAVGTTALAAAVVVVGTVFVMGEYLSLGVGAVFWGVAFIAAQLIRWTAEFAVLLVSGTGLTVASVVALTVFGLILAVITVQKLIWGLVILLQTPMLLIVREPSLALSEVDAWKKSWTPTFYRCVNLEQVENLVEPVEQVASVREALSGAVSPMRGTGKGRPTPRQEKRRPRKPPHLSAATG